MGTKQAAELFNWTIECGLFLADTKSQAVLRIGNAAEVAPFLIERILNRLSGIPERPNRPYQFPLGDFEQRFLPLAPMLEILSETVNPAEWALNRLALRIFFWLAEMYQSEVEKEVG